MGGKKVTRSSTTDVTPSGEHPAEVPPLAAVDDKPLQKTRQRKPTPRAEQAPPRLAQRRLTSRERPLSQPIGPSAPPPQPSSFKAPESTSYVGLDRTFKANLARITQGITPAGLARAYFDWFTHLMLAPGKQLQLVEKTGRKATRLAIYAAKAAADPKTPPCIEPLPQDRRFNDAGWRGWPYNLIYQSFLLEQQWWHNATTAIDGLSRRSQAVVSFVTRQLLDMASPSNFLWTNPEIGRVTLEQGGRNLVRGLNNAFEDWQRFALGEPPVGAEQYQAGKNLAVTPGKVVYQNRLIELIQYVPTTEEVFPEPIVIVPAWIMKYYILDLSPNRSLVEYLVGQGHTVFVLSWKNPGPEDRYLGMDDYQRLGVMAALDVVSKIIPNRKIHATGYCLGGTLLTIAAATMGRDGDDRLASMTLLASQSDFSEAGELGLFISESEVSYLEHMMWDQGYLDTHQMAGAFHILRSNDLIWSRVVHDYMLGERKPFTDIMAWNADLTRMPYRMHSEYLRRLYLQNDLATGRYVVGDRPVWLGDIRVPCFAVGTVADHVAPWRSVYKIHLQESREVTFVLTRGGHNSGIVSEPGDPRNRFQIGTRIPNGAYLDPNFWQAQTAYTEGSWWPAWEVWLAQRSGKKVAPPPLGTPESGYGVCRDAPGLYVLQR
jgi:polyhydroxyalkanoate synthase subunit PhaC